MRSILNIRNNRFLIFIWWLNIVAQSLVDLGVVYAIIFISTTCIILVNNFKDSIVLIAVAFFVPFTPSILGSPFAILMLISYVFYLLKVEFKLKISLGIRELSIYIFLFYCIFIALIFSHGDINQTVKSYFLSLVFFFIFSQIFLCIDSKLELERILKRVCLYCSLALFISLIHFYLGDNSNLSILISESDTLGIFAGKQFLDSTMAVKRIIWAGLDPNFFASSFIFMWFVCFYIARTDKLYLIFSLFIFLSIIGTFSRTAFLIFFLLLIPLLIKSQLKLMLKLIVMLSVFTISVIFYAPEYIDRVYSISENIKEYGGTGRFELLVLGVEVWKDNIMGVGLGNLSIGGFGSSIYVSNFSSHNTYTEILIESGVIGFLMFLAVVYFYVIHNNRKSELDNFLIIGLVGTLMFYFTIPVYDFRYLFLLFLIKNTHARLAKV